MKVGYQMLNFGTLDKLKVGDKARIKKIRADLKDRGRYFSMGLIHNKDIEVLRIAPMGDPMVVRVMNLELSLRKDEAAFIEIARNN